MFSMWAILWPQAVNTVTELSNQWQQEVWTDLMGHPVYIEGLGRPISTKPLELQFATVCIENRLEICSSRQELSHPTLSPHFGPCQLAEEGKNEGVRCCIQASLPPSLSVSVTTAKKLEMTKGGSGRGGGGGTTMSSSATIRPRGSL